MLSLLPFSKFTELKNETLIPNERVQFNVSIVKDSVAKIVLIFDGDESTPQTILLTPNLLQIYVQDTLTTNLALPGLEQCILLFTFTSDFLFVLSLISPTFNRRVLLKTKITRVNFYSFSNLWSGEYLFDLGTYYKMRNRYFEIYL